MRGNHINLCSELNAKKNKLLCIVLPLLFSCICIPTGIAFANSNANPQEQTPLKAYVSNEPAQGVFGEIMTKEITEISTLEGWAPKDLEDSLLEFIGSGSDAFDLMTFSDYITYTLEEMRITEEVDKSFIFAFLTYIQCYLDPNWVQQQYPKISLLEYSKEVLRHDLIFKSIGNLITAMQTHKIEDIAMVVLATYPEVIDSIKISLAAGEEGEPDVVKIKALRDNFKTRKANHDKGIPDPPIELQSQIYQIFQQFPALKMSKDEVNKYCSEYRYEYNSHSAEDAYKKMAEYLGDAVENNDLDKLKCSLVYYWCYWCSSLQYAFYNISETNNSNTISVTVEIAKTFLRSDIIFKVFASTLEVCEYETESEAEKIMYIATSLMSLFPGMKVEFEKAFEDETHMELFTKKANESLIPYNTSIAKIGQTTYPTLQAAFDAVKDNDTITLLGNYHTLDPVILTRTNAINTTLDLNNFCIEGHSNLDYIISALGNGVTLNITDSSVTEGGKVLSTNETNATCFKVENSAKILIDAGTYTENIEDSGYLNEKCIVVNNVVVNNENDDTYTVYRFDKYKDIISVDLFKYLQDGDSDNAPVILDEAAKIIKNTNYDSALTPTQNKAVIDKIVNDAKAGVDKDRQDNFEANKKPAILQMERLHDNQDSQQTKMLIDKFIANFETLEYDKNITPKENQGVIASNVESLQDELCSIRLPEFKKYKEEKIKTLRDMINSVDSAEVKAAIEQVIKEIETTDYDKTINLTDNEAKINEIAIKAENLSTTEPTQTGDFTWMIVNILAICFIVSGLYVVRKREHL